MWDKKNTLSFILTMFLFYNQLSFSESLPPQFIPLAKDRMELAPISDLYSLYHREVTLPDLTPEGVKKLNEQTIQELNKTSPKKVQKPRHKDAREKVASISIEEAQSVLDTININPVVGYYTQKKYDPTNEIGFCFGRALFVHLSLISRGLYKENIRKAFVVGTMQTGNVTWGFHVTTLAKGPKNNWISIDNVTGKAQTVEEWFEEVSNYSTDGKLRIYISEPERFGTNEHPYSPYHFNDPFYNDYFRDLMKWMKDKKTRSYFRENQFSNI